MICESVSSLAVVVFCLKGALWLWKSFSERYQKEPRPCTGSNSQPADIEKKEIIDLSAMSSDHQVDEQLIGGFIHVATDPQSLPRLSGVQSSYY